MLTIGGALALGAWYDWPATLAESPTLDGGGTPWTVGIATLAEAPTLDGAGTPWTGGITTGGGSILPPPRLGALEFLLLYDDIFVTVKLLS